MEESQKYWIWLQNALGVNNQRLMKILDFFGTAENIYCESEKGRLSSGFFTPLELERLSSVDAGYGLSKMELCEHLGLDIVALDSTDYPSRLKSLASPPIVLYLKGKLPDSDAFHVGMVGTRNPNETGKCLAYNFAFDLALEHAVIVSGGALGVDCFSHNGCLDAGGSTICVLGCSIDSYNLKMSRHLLEEVPKRGAVISEYPPVFGGTKYSYPLRNRIISCLSDCTLVVQAGFGSGALITAKYAYVQKKKLFTIPGDSDYVHAAGSNFLVRNGFSYALNYKDILRWHEQQSVLGTVEENGGNPLLDRHFFEAISCKAEDYQTDLPEIKRRKLTPPECYQITAAVYAKYGNDYSEQLPLFVQPVKKTEMTLATSPVTEVPVVTKLMKDTSEHEEKAPKGFPLNETIVRQNKEYYLNVLDDLTDRAVKREPEPKGSLTEQMTKMFGISSDVARLNLIKMLSDWTGRRSGFSSLPVSSIDEMFMEENLIRSDDVSPSGKIEIPDLNQFPEEETSVLSEKTHFSNKKSTINKALEKQKPIILKNNEKSAQIDDNKICGNVENHQKEEKVLSEQLTENALEVYHTISDTPIHVDSIKIAAKLSVREVLSALTELVVADLIKQLPGRRYIRK